MPAATIPLKGNASMESKKVSISSKRQITIPQKFFTLLGFNTEAECIMRGNELILRPVKENTSGEFAEQILADLIRQGYSGEELLEKFKQAYPDAFEANVKMPPMGHFGDVEKEIGRACVQLASPDFKYMNGDTITLEGGMGQRP